MILKDLTPNKTKVAGLVQAILSLGVTYPALGDKAKALSELQAYQSLHPGDANVRPMIEAIGVGNVAIRK